MDAIIEVGIIPKTLADCVTLRKHAKMAKPQPPPYPASAFNRPLMDLTKKSQFLVGNSNCGKTMWALSHFKAPIVVRQNEGFKWFDPNEHDGIVIDDMDFRTWTYTDVQHLLDMEVGSTMSCKFGSYYLPAHTPKIFTSSLPIQLSPKLRPSTQKWGFLSGIPIQFMAL